MAINKQTSKWKCSILRNCPPIILIVRNYSDWILGSQAFSWVQHFHQAEGTHTLTHVPTQLLARSDWRRQKPVRSGFATQDRSWFCVSQHCIPVALGFLPGHAAAGFLVHTRCGRGIWENSPIFTCIVSWGSRVIPGALLDDPGQRSVCKYWAVPGFEPNSATGKFSTSWEKNGPSVSDVWALWEGQFPALDLRHLCFHMASMIEYCFQTPCCTWGMQWRRRHSHCGAEATRVVSAQKQVCKNTSTKNVDDAS